MTITNTPFNLEPAIRVLDVVINLVIIYVLFKVVKIEVVINEDEDEESDSKVDTNKE